MIKVTMQKQSKAVVPNSLQPHGLQPTRILCPWDFPGKDSGVGCHFLLQGIFPTQGLNPGLLHCRQIPYHQNHQGSPELCLLRANYKVMGRFSTVWRAGMPNLHIVQGELYCVLCSELSKWTISCCPDTTLFFLPHFCLCTSSACS